MVRLLTDHQIKDEFLKYDFDLEADDEMLKKVGNVIAIVRKAQDAKSVREERKAMAVWLDDLYEGKGGLTVYGAANMLREGKAPWEEK